MPDTLGTVLILICLLQVKHMFADYFLQTPKMLCGRSAYFHMGRAQHAGIHALGSAIALLIVGSHVWVLFALIAVEWVLHFHIDWGKARYSAVKGHGPNEAGYWRANGFDQALHQLTYVGMAWAWANYGANG